MTQPSPSSGEKREHVMPGDPDHLQQTALQWYLDFQFGYPHSVRESNIAVEAFKDGYRAAREMSPEDVERVARALFCRAERWPLTQMYSDSVNHWFATNDPDDKASVDDLREDARAALQAIQGPSS